MRDLIEGRGFVMFSHYGLIQVLRVEEHAKGTIRLEGVG